MTFTPPRILPFCTHVNLAFCRFLPSFSAARGGTEYACQVAMAVLRHPTGQVLFAAWVAVLAGLAAWYLM